MKSQKDKKEIAKFLLRIEDGLKKKVTKQADLENRSLNSQIIHIIEKSLLGGK